MLQDLYDILEEKKLLLIFVEDCGYRFVEVCFEEQIIDDVVVIKLDLL